MNRELPEQVFFRMSLYIKTKMPVKWMASAAMKKWLWSLTECLSATSVATEAKTATKTFTFVDCRLTHANNVFADEESLLCPIFTAHRLSYNIIYMQREREREDLLGSLLYWRCGVLGFLVLAENERAVWGDTTPY